MAEDEKERIDRELIELLNELRVALPGVQVLFAFLLVVPFSQGFTEVTEFQRYVYFVTLLCTGIATALLIAPSPYHRIHFRQHNKEELLRNSNRFTIAGIAFLAVAMAGAIMLITDVLFGAVTTAIVSAAAAATFGWFWYLLPLRRR